MSFAPETHAKNQTLADPKALLRVPVGLVSPLWPLFAGAAMSGATWWWMTRWARPANLEAMFGAAAEADAGAATAAVALAEPAVEAAEAVVETVTEPVVEALIEAEAVVETAAEPVVEPTLEPAPEAAAESVLEALVEAPAALEPVGGEAAPISPVLEAAPLETLEPAPKPKKKPAPPKAD
jgi:hypothetical protein